MKVLGIDIGGTSIKAGIWRGDERLSWQEGIPQIDSADGDAVADYMTGVALEHIKGNGGDVSAVGIGSCGVITGGLILESPNTTWDRVDMQRLVGRELGLPVFVVNDADAFMLDALGELTDRHVVAMGITLGTGLGTSFWLRDHLLVSGGGISPHGGHITINHDEGFESTAGIRGSWESLANIAALMRFYAELGGQADNPQQVAQVADDGGQAAIEAWNRFGRMVGVGLASHCNTFAPEAVVIGGGLSRAHTLYEQSMKDTLHCHMMKSITRPEIIFTGHRPDTVARGAAINAKMKVQDA